jgi:hypothetical protein
MSEARPENVTEVFHSKPTSALFSADEAQGFRERWDAVQTEFVDEPRKSVQEADNLVESVIQRLSQIFTDERGKLEAQWEKGDNASTEDLRLALQRYRSFFTRLLSV